VRTFQPDVILVDMVMPGMSGVDVLDALRGAEVTVLVILIAGHLIRMPEGFSESSESLSISASWLRSSRRPLTIDVPTLLDKQRRLLPTYLALAAVPHPLAPHAAR
jgi:hypothetical protein